MKPLAVCKVSVWTDQKRPSKFFSRGSLQSLQKYVLRQNDPVHRDARVGSQLHTSNNPRHFWPYTYIPGLVKKILKKCSGNSTPGPDKVTYSCLKKLPSTHKFLATLYSKIILKTQEWPHTWCTTNLSLIYKSGNPASQLSTNCPNFSSGENLA